MAYNGSDDLNLKATELRLGLPGSDEVPANPIRSSYKRGSSEISEESCVSRIKSPCDQDCAPPPPKAQVVGWPPIRSYRKNNVIKKNDEMGSGMYVKVSLDGAPYLRKVDVKMYNNYPELLKALEVLFKLTIGEYSEREGYDGSEFVPTYEDKDGDWMLVGDVPWGMFINSCKRLRIMKASEAKGLGCL